ncbi:MAG: hypothetical protein KGJ57_15455 [Sphingomonadales bacterium]|nr:hypothetical protein [Sphingomonadales bacterium]MDE2170799.1 hypothetical protein [Sphingomonadales bacterium]
MKTFKTGAAIASAAAMLALSGIAMTAPAHAAGAKAVPCYGVNSCKGTSDCKSGTHDCKGQNDCKGQGFKEISAKACKAQGGSLTPKG